MDERRKRVVTGEQVQHACLDGTFKPMGPRVLVRAIHEEHDERFDELTKGLDGKQVALDVRDAVAFEVVRLGPLVPRDYGLEPGMIVTHTSACADTVDHTDPKCPYQTVHYEDITGGLL